MLRKISVYATAAVGAAVTLGSVSSAQAVTFSFGGLGGAASSYTFSAGGLTTTVTASNSFGPRNVVQRPFGLGVRSNFFDDVEIDGFGPNESLQLLFGTTGNTRVVLNSATFARVGFNDDFTVTNNDNLLSGTFDIPGGNISDTGVGTFSFTSFARSDRTGSGFTFGAVGRNDDYFLKAVDVSTIPEPITILGTLAAVGVGTGLKQKFRRSQDSNDI